MKKMLLFNIMAMIMGNTLYGADNFYALTSTTLSGEEYKFEQLKGKYVLIVNTASKCGYTKQYAGLQELWQKYGDRLIVLGFPCNQFGGQEKGDNAEIGAFCTKNFGVTFPLMQKSDVKGKAQNSVYQWLTDKGKNGWNTETPSWNFGKYLIDPEGKLLKYFPSKVEPMDAGIVGIIEDKKPVQ